MKELRNSVAIVGVDESDEIGTLPGVSMLSLHVQAVFLRYFIARLPSPAGTAARCARR